MARKHRQITKMCVNCKSFDPVDSSSPIVGNCNNKQGRENFQFCFNGGCNFWDNKISVEVENGSKE